MAARAVRRAVDAPRGIPAVDARARGAARRRPEAVVDARHAPPRYRARLSALLRRLQGDGLVVRAGRISSAGRPRSPASSRSCVTAAITHAEILAHLRETHPELTEMDWRRMVRAVRRHAHLIHARETAAWTTSPAAVYEPVEAPAEIDARRREASSSAATSGRSARRRRQTSRIGPASASATSSTRSTASTDATRTRGGTRAVRRPACAAPGGRRARAGALPAEVGQRHPRLRRSHADHLRRDPQAGDRARTATSRRPCSSTAWSPPPGWSIRKGR